MKTRSWRLTMRRKIVAVPHLLLCGTLLLLTHGLHAETTTDVNPPNRYHAASGTGVAGLNKAYAQGSISYPEYETRFLQLEKSANRDSSSHDALGTTLTGSSGGPTSVIPNDRGLYAGNHYWETYWALPPGYTCIDAKTLVSHGPSNLAVYLVTPSSSTVSQSYAGPSGFSPNVCQVNVYAPAGTPMTDLQFNYNSYVD